MDIIETTTKLLALFNSKQNPLFDERGVQIIELANKWVKLNQISPLSQEAAEQYLEMSSKNLYALMFLYSLLGQSKSIKLNFDQLVKQITQSELHPNEKFFLYNQLKSLSFQGLNAISKSELSALYTDILSSFNSYLAPSLRYISASERNNNLVIVFTGQFLGMQHAPSKTALDRIRVLIETLNKEVVFINTCELLTAAGAIPWYGSTISTRYEFEQQIIEFKGCHFKFAQCSKAMPNLQEMASILDVVKALRPSFTLTIGESLLADISSQIVPNLVIATVFSSLPYTRSQFRVIGRPVTADDSKFLEEQNLSPEGVLESLFTFDFKPQTHHYTRTELNLPSDKFVVMMVGARLDSEITTAFIETLRPLFNKGVCFVTVGQFDCYERYCQQIPGFEESFVHLGFQEDILAVLECCDLYLNPPRVGGGSSVAEALYKQKPVVTLNKGDGAVTAGQAFVVEDDELLVETICRYKEDAAFYFAQQQEAEQRAALLTNSDKAFAEVIQLAFLNTLFDLPWQVPTKS